MEKSRKIAIFTLTLGWGGHIWGSGVKPGSTHLKKWVRAGLGVGRGFLHEEILPKAKIARFSKKSPDLISRLLEIWRLGGPLTINFGGVKSHPLGRKTRQKPSFLDGFSQRYLKKTTFPWVQNSAPTEKGAQGASEQLPLYG